MHDEDMCYADSAIYKIMRSQQSAAAAEEKAV